MSEKNPQNKTVPRLEDLSNIPVDQIANDTTTDFDLYMKVASTFVLYAPSSYKWQGGESDRLIKEGHAVLYYSNSDETKVEAYRQLAKLPEIDTTSEPKIRILNLTEVGMELTRILYDYPLTVASMAKAEEISVAMINSIQEDRTCVAALGKLANHDYYTYYHSARVAAYALAIAMQQSESDQGRLEELALGCLLHDIGKSKVETSIINKPGSLSETEWGKMRQHPEFGDQIVSGSVISAVPRGIILSHHERIDGKGYPHGLSDRELLPEIKIAAFADVFDALTTNRSYQSSRSRFEALDLIRFKLLAGLDNDVFKAMVEILEKGKSIEQA